MNGTGRLPPKDEIPPNICMNCLKIDYQRWGRELFPKVYEGEGFDVQSVPDSLLKTVLSKMNPTAFTRMRRVTRFYSRFIETHRHLIKICLFHNRKIKFSLATIEDSEINKISLTVAPMFPLPRGIAWEEIDEMNDEEAEKRNRKLDEEAAKTVTFNNSSTVRVYTGLAPEYFMIDQGYEILMINEIPAFQLEPMSSPELFREITGYCKPSAVSVEFIKQPTDGLIDTTAACLKFMNIEDKDISFSMVSDYCLQKISQVMNPRRLKIDLHSNIVENSLFQNRLGPSNPICSFHNFQNLTHLYLSSSSNILPNFPINILRQLEVLFLDENGAEWTQVARQILQMFRDGTGRIRDIAIGEITPQEGNSFSNLTNRSVDNFKLKPYARRSRMIKDLMDQYKTDFFLVRNQITHEIGIMHISYELRFIKP